MHKLAKGLKKKKKQKKGKKGAEEDEFDPEELERYRRERAEAQQKAEDSGEQASNASSDEWKKFEALTAGVDSILKKTQGDLDRIKSTSFFQRKPPLDEERKKEGEEGEEAEKDQEDPGKKKSSSSRKWVGFDEEGNPIEGEPPDFGGKKRKEEGPLVNEDGFVDVPEDEDGHEDSADEDIFDTAYVDVLQNIDVQLAYIPDSPVEEEAGDDPFDTTSADKVLKTVDKKGNKLVSLGNAVEVLSGRIDYVSSCKISKSGRRPRLQQDLLLDDFDSEDSAGRQTAVESGESAPLAAEPVQSEKTLLDDDSDLPPIDIPIDLAKLPPTVLPTPASPAVGGEVRKDGPLDISEFEVLKEKTILEEIPDLDEAEFELNGCAATDEEPVRLEEAEDPFGAKESEIVNYQSEIIEASFEAATFVDEEDPFDTTFADNILPGKTELKFIEKELDELPVSEVTISLTDPAGLNRDYETGLLKEVERAVASDKRDLLGGSTTDLSRLADEPIAPLEDISSYVDPFDTSSVKEIPPGKTELKFLEKELLGEKQEESSLDDEDFDPRRGEEQQRPFGTVDFQVEEEKEEEEKEGKESETGIVDRRSSRPEVLELGVSKAVAFELPTPSKRPDLLATTEEEKALPSKPLTPYYTQKSIEDYLPGEEEQEEEAADVDPFDTSFVAKVAPGKTELKLIESELLRQQDHPSSTRLPHSLSDHEFDPRAEGEPVRRQSDFTIRPNDLRINELQNSVLKKFEEVNNKRRELVEKRQESLLDESIEVDAKPLTPRIETKTIEEDEEISYQDPFDTSIATNILPGKAELKILETELEQIPAEIPVARPVPIALSAVINATVIPEVDPDFDPRAEERKDFLCIDDQDPGAKVLTPLQNESFPLGEDVDPFDTSFASLGPGKTELKLLESELMEK